MGGGILLLRACPITQHTFVSCLQPWRQQIKVLSDNYICQTAFIFYFQSYLTNNTLFKFCFTVFPQLIASKPAWFCPPFSLFCPRSSDTSNPEREIIQKQNCPHNRNYPNLASLRVLRTSSITRAPECCFKIKIYGVLMLNFFLEHLFCAFGWHHFLLRELLQYNKTLSEVRGGVLFSGRYFKHFTFQVALWRQGRSNLNTRSHWPQSD